MNSELKTALREHFGYENFRDGQAEIIEAVRSGTDCVGVLPTGAGKSLCYQLPAVMSAGVTLVVSPLIALMKDQVDALNKRGIAATFINSSIEWSALKDRLDGLRRGQFRLVYVAPERFRSESFRAALRGAQIELFAVDEAHCISMWGHDFRPDYQRLGGVLEELGGPQVVALTATATPHVRDDIAAQLGLGTGPRGVPAVIVSGFARRNLTLKVERVQGQDDKLGRTRGILADRGTGIVYCATRKNVDRVADSLNRAGIDCVAYHAGLNEAERRERQERFVSGQTPVAVATNAFGMGIDRADLRAIIHWDIPGSVEAYYQEAGRAGRDGDEALCSLLFNFADVRTQEFFIEGANPPPDLVRQVARVVAKQSESGPIDRNPENIASGLDGERTNKMAINTALTLLERAGMVRSVVDGNGRGEFLELVDANVDLSELCSGLEVKAERDREKLRRMLDYVNVRSCRHRFMLDYFGDRQEFDDCRQCDGCLRRDGADGNARREPTAEEWLHVQKALSAVARLNGRFGLARIAGVLAGSREKEIFRLGLEKLPTYGALGTWARRLIRELLEQLIDAGCLQLADGEYPVVGLTEHGQQVMRREASVRLAWPSVPAGKSPSGIPGTKGENTPRVQLEDSDPLTARLMDWRRELSASKGIPAYHVLTNASLHEVAQVRPSNLDELEQVRGIGPAKLEQYGEEVLRLVAHPDSTA